MNPLLLLALTAMVFFVTVTLVLLVVGPTILLKPRRRSAEFYRSIGRPASPGEGGLRHEEIIVRTKDGIRLHSWLVRAQGPARGTVVYLHGVADCKIDGIPLARLFRENGYHVFLYDSRRHGESDGLYCTYGYYEKHDVVSVLDYIRSRPDLSAPPIALFGTSMGAAVALQAAAMDSRVRAVIAENSFATLRSIFDDYQKRMIKLPFHYLRNLVIKRSELIARFRANDVSPLDAVGNISIPLLVIAGERDSLIDSGYSRSLFAAAGEPKEFYAIPEASHSDTWAVAGKRYEETILAFLRKSLS
jgi:alpha-beta hydrolase superfamily lysophospholipase